MLTQYFRRIIQISHRYFSNVNEAITGSKLFPQHGYQINCFIWCMSGVAFSDAYDNRFIHEVDVRLVRVKAMMKVEKIRFNL